jgi:hypothetical protein
MFEAKMRGLLSKAIALAMVLPLLILPLPSLGQESGDIRYIVHKTNGEKIEGILVYQDAAKLVLRVRVEKTESTTVEIPRTEIASYFRVPKSKGTKGLLWGAMSGAAAAGIGVALQKRPEQGIPGQPPSDKKTFSAPLIIGAVVIGAAIGYIIAKSHKKTKVVIPADTKDSKEKNKIRNE